uniref:Uncharacterized protein n=1 Tax=Arundo donax TaxID=35708 RepID=A0A0A8YAS7_ARUDO
MCSYIFIIGFVQITLLEWDYVLNYLHFNKLVYTYQALEMSLTATLSYPNMNNFSLKRLITSNIVHSDLH